MSEKTAPAYAKINLALAVDQPDASGMHPIASWMAPIALADTVTIRALDAAPETLLHIEWAPGAPMASPIDWPAEKDLCVRALRALEAHAGEALHCEIMVKKRVPTGGGLGGGSSDAATTLRLLNELFELDVSAEELQRIGSTLGSDIPFFLDETDTPRAALVTGLGDAIERVAINETHLALIVPDFPCATGPVYQAFDALDPAPFRGDDVAAMAREGAVVGEALFNDLAPAAESVEFVLGSIRSRAEQIAGAPVHVTGSGSAMFIVCENEGDARARAAAAGAELSGCATLATRTL